MSMPVFTSPRRRHGSIAVALATSLGAGLVAWVAPPAPAADVVEAPAVVETQPSDEPADTLDDPAIWVDPVDSSRSVIIGADHLHDHENLSVYDMSGKRIQKLDVEHANNVDLRPGFSLGGKTVALVGLAGRGIVSLYRLDPDTRLLENVTPGKAFDKHVLQGSLDEQFSAHGFCFYDSRVTDRLYAFVVGREGVVKQFEVSDDGAGQVAIKEVRHFVVGPTKPEVGGSGVLEGCVADDVRGSVFVGEQDHYIWRYGAEVGDPSGLDDRVMVDEHGGHFERQAEGLAFVQGPGDDSYLIASSQGDDSFTVYQGSAPYDFIRKVHVVGSGAVDGCERTDGIDAVFAKMGEAFPQGIFVCQDNANDGGNMNMKVAALETVLPLGSALPEPPSGPGPDPGPDPDPAPDPGNDPQPPADPGPGPDPAPQAATSGYWMLGSTGNVFAFGDAGQHGDVNLAASVRAVDLEPTPSGAGYWVVDEQGQVHTRGDAVLHGQVDPAQMDPGETVTSLSATPTGAGYRMFTSRGRMFAFGDATHLGDMSETRLNGAVLDSVTTPTGEGYFMVAADGGIFTFGDAVFHGSMGHVRLNQPVQSLVPDPDGSGYWLVASDGGVFAFQAPFRGSMGAVRLNKPVTGMVAFGNGYLMVGEDGGIFNFSDQPFHGSLGAAPPPHPITAVAAAG